MIQRIQSIFLVAVIGIGIALFFTPLYSYTDAQAKQVAETAMNRSGFMALTALLMLVAAVALFMYNRRILQSKIALAGGVLSIFTFVLVFIFPKEMADLPETTRIKTEPGTWFYLAMDFFFVASFIFIRKDEKLVRSADRIR